MPNKTDRRAYHRVTDGEGETTDGFFHINNNSPGNIKSGNYAAHTWKLNTGSIGSSICAMGGGVWNDPFGGRFPVKPIQVDALVKDTVLLCKEYHIGITPRTVLSHAEVEITLGVKQKNKWDFDYSLWGKDGRDAIAIGNELRQEIISQLGGKITPPVDSLPVLRQGSQGQVVRKLQLKLYLTVDGIFGPLTRRAVVDFQHRNGLLPDGIVGRMTWEAL